MDQIRGLLLVELLCLAVGMGQGDVGEGGAVGRAMPVLLAGGDERGVALGNLDFLGLVGDDSGALGDIQNLVAGVGVEFVLGPSREVHLGEVVIGASLGPDDGLSGDLPAVEKGRVGCVYFGNGIVLDYFHEFSFIEYFVWFHDPKLPC